MNPFVNFIGVLFLSLFLINGTFASSGMWAPVVPPTLECRTRGGEIGDFQKSFPAICHPVPVLKMPEDYGVHSYHEREWWYYIGNALTDDNQRVGFMFSVTREYSFYSVTLSVMGKSIPNQYWQTTMISMDAAIQGGDPFSITLNDVFHNEAKFIHDFAKKQLTIHAKIKKDSKSISLNLVANISKSGVLQGVAGFSQKSLSDPRIASLYYSETRMEIAPSLAVPQIQLNDRSLRLSRGTLYHDHEISNSVSFSKNDFVGWDWVGLQFDNQTEWVAFQMRKSNASIPQYSAKSMVNVAQDGSYRTSAAPETFDLTPMGRMELHSGITYPSSFRLQVKDPVKSEVKVYYLIPIVNEAELLHFSHLYGWWEGAVDVYSDPMLTQKVGWGFLEMTGYAKPAVGYQRNYLPFRLLNSGFSVVN